jgi:hypothetical protein
MHIAKVTIEGTSPYSQSRNIDKLEHPKKPKEQPDDYEQRTWRYRMHVDSEGYVEIPGTAFADSLKAAARRLQLQVPSKGKTQWTKYFEAGIDVPMPTRLGVKADSVVCDRLFVPSDAKQGGGTRVYRHFPRIEAGWSGGVTFFVMDDMITESVFTQVLRSAGILVGIGRFRPEKRGFYGRFRVNSVEWIEDGDAAMGMAAE